MCVYCLVVDSICTRPLLQCKHSFGVDCGEQGPSYRQEAVPGRGRWVWWRTARRCQQAAEGRRGLNRTRTRIWTRTTWENDCWTDQRRNTKISVCWDFKPADRTKFYFSSLLLVAGVILGSHRLEAAGAGGAGGGSSLCSTSCRRSSAPWRLHTLKLLARHTSSWWLANCCNSSWRQERGGGKRDIRLCCLLTDKVVSLSLLLPDWPEACTTYQVQHTKDIFKISEHHLKNVISSIQRMSVSILVAIEWSLAEIQYIY